MTDDFREVESDCPAWLSEKDPPAHTRVRARDSRKCDIPDSPFEDTQKDEDAVPSGHLDMEALNADYYGKAEHWADILTACDQLVAGEGLFKLVLCLSGISSGLHPSYRIHVLATGESQTGKSYVMNRIGSQLFPKRFDFVNSASAKSIYYMCKEDPSAVRGKIRCYEEFGDQSEEMRNQIKAMTSREIDRLVLETVSERKSFLGCEVTGLPNVWTNMAASPEDAGFDQVLNRFLKINTDESAEQDGRVQNFQREREKRGPTEVADSEVILVARQRLSEIIGDGNFIVLNPFADFITMRRLKHRGYRPMLMGLISAFTLSNRFIPRRPRVKNTMLATHSDVIAGINVWAALEKWQFSNVKERILQVLRITPDSYFVSPEELVLKFQEEYGFAISAATIYQYLHEAEKRDLVTSTKQQLEIQEGDGWHETRRGRPTKVFKRLQTPGEGLTRISSKVYRSSSLEYSVPEIDELAKVLERDFPNFLEGKPETGQEVAARLLDFDFIPHLKKALENSISIVLDFSRNEILLDSKKTRQSKLGGRP